MSNVPSQGNRDKPINEGWIKKGLTNSKPSTPKPPPPKGQGPKPTGGNPL